MESSHTKQLIALCITINSFSVAHFLAPSLCSFLVSFVPGNTMRECSSRSSSLSHYTVHQTRFRIKASHKSHSVHTLKSFDLDVEQSSARSNPQYASNIYDVYVR